MFEESMENRCLLFFLPLKSLTLAFYIGSSGVPEAERPGGPASSAVDPEE